MRALPGAKGVPLPGQAVCCFLEPARTFQALRKAPSGSPAVMQVPAEWSSTEVLWRFDKSFTFVFFHYYLFSGLLMSHTCQSNPSNWAFQVSIIQVVELGALFFIVNHTHISGLEKPSFFTLLILSSPGGFNFFRLSSVPTAHCPLEYIFLLISCDNI